MTTFDFSPLYRTSVGFDRLAALMSTATRQDQGNSYPPYNIRVTSEDHYRITMAVAGFSENDIDITSEQNRLLITGNRADEPEEQGEYLHRGIATRSFERRFNLADHVRVISASLENGLLHIDLEREIPETMKPRTIKVEKAAARLLDTGQAPKDKEALATEDKAA